MSDTAVASDVVAPRLPRFFWRRLLALVIDQICVFLILVPVTFLLSGLLPAGVGAYLYSSTSCEPAPTGELTAQVEQAWVLEPGWQRANFICVVQPFGGLETRYFQSIATITDGTLFKKRAISFELDADNHLIAPSSTDAVIGASNSFLPTIVLILASASLTSRGRRSPGKRLMSLSVEKPDGSTPSFSSAILREILRFLPLFILVISFAYSAYMLTAIVQDGSIAAQNLQSVENNVVPSLLIGMAISLCAVFWWGVPFLFWRGQTFYDAISGCVVVRHL